MFCSLWKDHGHKEQHQEQQQHQLWSPLKAAKAWGWMLMIPSHPNLDTLTPQGSTSTSPCCHKTSIFTHPASFKKRNTTQKTLGTSCLRSFVSSRKFFPWKIFADPVDAMWSVTG